MLPGGRVSTSVRGLLARFRPPNLRSERTRRNDPPGKDRKTCRRTRQAARVEDWNMGGSFGFLDIILFAMVAAFLVYRLGTNLGKRTGPERRRDPFGPIGAPQDAPAATANLVTLPDRGHEGPAVQNIGKASCRNGGF